jgi:hypothetical protein
MKSDEDNIVLNDMCQNPVYNMILNGSITESEIIDAIKNGKAAGIDNFVNEYFHNRTVGIFIFIVPLLYSTGY